MEQMHLIMHYTPRNNSRLVGIQLARLERIPHNGDRRASQRPAQAPKPPAVWSSSLGWERSHLGDSSASGLQRPAQAPKRLQHDPAFQAGSDPIRGTAGAGHSSARRGR